MVVFATGGAGAGVAGVHLFHVKGTTALNTRAVEGKRGVAGFLCFFFALFCCVMFMVRFDIQLNICGM